MGVKGSRHRLQKGDKEKYDNSPLWKKQDNEQALEGKSKEDLKKLNVEILEDEK